MNISKLVTNIEQWDEKSKNDFFAECLSHFGSMNKNDYEVALFHLLMKNEFINQESDFVISVRLQIPESKVKRLRYEMNLVYTVEDSDLDTSLLSKLKNGDFKLSNDRIQLCINDKILRLYLNNKLFEGKRFADSSFNSNIVSITANDLSFLLNGISGINDEDRIKIINEVKAKLKASLEELPLNTKEKIVKYGISLIKTLGYPLLDSVVDVTINELVNCINNKK